MPAIATASFELTSPYFLLDLSSVSFGPVFILGTSVLGGPDVLGGSLRETGDTLVDIVSVNAFTQRINVPIAAVAEVGLTLSPSTNLLQAISGIAFCYNTRGTVAEFVVQTMEGAIIKAYATYNGRQVVNVGYGLS